MFLRILTESLRTQLIEIWIERLVRIKCKLQVRSREFEGTKLRTKGKINQQNLRSWQIEKLYTFVTWAVEEGFWNWNKWVKGKIWAIDRRKRLRT